MEDCTCERDRKLNNLCSYGTCKACCITIDCDEHHLPPLSVLPLQINLKQYNKEQLKFIDEAISCFLYPRELGSLILFYVDDRRTCDCCNNKFTFEYFFRCKYCKIYSCYLCFNLVLKCCDECSGLNSYH